MAKEQSTIQQLREIGAEQLRIERGLDPATAADYAAVMTAGIQKRYRGEAIYIGVGKAELEEKRNWLIWERFDGSNYEELGREFSGWNGLGSLTGRQVYTIIGNIRPQAIAKVQPGLFGGGE